MDKSTSLLRSLSWSCWSDLDAVPLYSLSYIALLKIVENEVEFSRGFDVKHNHLPCDLGKNFNFVNLGFFHWGGNTDAILTEFLKERQNKFMQYHSVMTDIGA
jgi:hypothetical protein